jgi:uncharacterized lipoprotein
MKTAMKQIAVAVTLMVIAGCSSSAGLKRDQLICLGLCWEAETGITQTTGTTKPKGRKDHD